MNTLIWASQLTEEGLHALETPHVARQRAARDAHAAQGAKCLGMEGKPAWGCIDPGLCSLW